MVIQEMIENLQKAQVLLAEVYSEAYQDGNEAIESAMSVADGCIIDALNYLSLSKNG